MKDAAANGGVLPTNWEASYYDKHGFAPIYNPGTGEMCSSRTVRRRHAHPHCHHTDGAGQSIEPHGG